MTGVLERLRAAVREWPSSAWALLAANVGELVGVFVFGWDALLLAFVYWCENVAIGLVNIPRLALAGGLPTRVVGWLERAIAIPFFIVHFGMFTGFQGFLIGAMWRWFSGGRKDKPSGPLEFFTAPLEGGGWPLWLALALMFGGHLYSFFANTIVRREYRHTDVGHQMGAPHKRVAVMMVATIAGMLLLTLLEAPQVFAVVLVPLKAAVDVRAHLKERARLAAAGS